jgi:hypothetical protein
MTLEDLQERSSDRFPEPDRAIVRRRGQRPPILREADRVHRIGMTVEGPQ